MKAIEINCSSVRGCVKTIQCEFRLYKLTTPVVMGPGTAVSVLRWSACTVVAFGEKNMIGFESEKSSELRRFYNSQFECLMMIIEKLFCIVSCRTTSSSCMAGLQAHH